MSTPDDKLTKPYDPGATESAIYQRWEASGYFNPDHLPGDRPDAFTIVMPPPNANGRLHAGHGLDMTLKDIVVRFARMKGLAALFLPGADHAGFETQMVFEKKLAKEGRSRFRMTREELYREIYEFTMENRSAMENDIRRLGTSCDWSRKKFTLDADIVHEVQNTFIKMYRDGLVYRGKRIVNWNPKFQTSLADVETEFVEQTDPFYYITYGPFTIGTVRPETKFGDKYVVMHPGDSRYTSYTHGQKIALEWINGPITATIIKDTAVDQAFGSGVMTITPWHSAVDFDIAERHGLDKEQIIDWDGRLLPLAREFAGMKIDEARPKIVAKLKKKGLLVKVNERYQHAVRLCERTKVPIEPQIKDQWFVRMKPLADKVIEAIEKRKEIVIMPEHQKRILLHWMHNTIDWNISRQIAWGIPIPAWFKGEAVEIGHDAPGEGWARDPDTFDTWFSSGQWPLVTLGYPDNADFKRFYPTDLMETGSDLVFKWVPRMIMFGLYLSGKIPFRTVYFHGMVNDEHNQKMSKSKGNVVSPLDVSGKFGTDALRMALTVGNPPGGSIPLSEQKIKAYKHFANKLWNVTRFVLGNTADRTSNERPTPTEEDETYLKEHSELVQDVTDDLERYQLHLAAEKLYHYFWHTFADVIIEKSKAHLRGNDAAAQASAQWMIDSILRSSLKLLHPFMPFITEEIWSLLPRKQGEQELLMVERWPV